MKRHAIYLCGATAMRAWEYLRGVWKPRLDQLRPLPQRLKQQGIQSAHLDRIEGGDCETERALGMAREGLARLSEVAAVRQHGRGVSCEQLARGAADPEGLARAVLEAGPLETLAAPGSRRHRSTARIDRLWGGPVPPHAFVELVDGVYLATPEFALCQLSAGMSLASLTMWLYELRGAYATSFGGAEPWVRCLPLTDGAHLARFLEGLAGRKGSTRLLRAVRLSADNAGSVMESAMVLLVVFPRRWGGYGLAIPALNLRIDVPAPLRETVGKPWVACDALWPDARVALEYDGRLDHAGDANVRRDHRRANVLSVLGIRQLTVTGDVLFNASAFDKVVREVAGLIGCRLYARDFDTKWFQSRHALRGEVFRMLAGDESPREDNL